MIYLFILICFGLWTAYVASNRGRNVIGAFILGFLFTWIALLIYLIIGDTQELRDEKLIQREVRIKKLRRQYAKAKTK